MGLHVLLQGHLYLFIEVSGELHAMAHIPQEKQALVTIGYEISWTLGPI
jgi:hypothetical protein